MSDEPSPGVRLCGTDETPPEERRLKAGPLEAVLDQGALRNITIAGREAIRGIAYVLRDRNWATPIPAIHDLDVTEDDTGFLVTYRGSHETGDERFSFTARILAAPDGALEFSVEACPATDWVTNRTGFVVLHPVDGVAGEPVTVTHTDGLTSEERFPDLISPTQPFFDIRSMTHRVSGSLTVTCTMEGDAFEAEDQRNWTDASYKTYIRPLSKPRPYVMKAGVKNRQRVSLRTDGVPDGGTGTGDHVVVTLVQASTRRMPLMALACDPENVDDAFGALETMRLAGARRLWCHHDPSRGHDADDMARLVRLASAIGADPVLEAVLPLQSPDGRFSNDPALLEAEVQALRTAAASHAFTHIAASPLAYHKSYQPSETWPDVPSCDMICRCLREAFPDAAIGGGMHSYFTELNRKPPPDEAIDFITHTTCPMVHAGDDRSVMESLEALPSVMRSAMALAPGKPYLIGPSAIGMRFNPYGAAPVDNPDNRRLAMARVDPRQRGLFNAAWLVGYIAAASAHGLDGLCLAAPTGAFGLVHRRQAWHQPWYDDNDSRTLVYPAFHVFRDVARHGGCAVVDVAASDPARVRAIAFEDDRGPVLWLANLTPAPQGVTVKGLPHDQAAASHGNMETFTSLARDPLAMSSANASPVDPSSIMLGAYGVCRLSVFA